MELLISVIYISVWLNIFLHRQIFMSVYVEFRDVTLRLFIRQ
jgi:hypothetical protein